MSHALPQDAVVPGRFTRPEQVPGHVSEELLCEVLRHGRPEGDEDDIVVDGVRCATIHRGSGRPVLCIHGLGHDSWDWAPLFAAGIDDVALLTLDLPGFGLSDKPARPYDLALLVEAVLAAARLCSRPPVVVASSLGGHVALLAALQEPDAIGALFLSAPGGLEVAPPTTVGVARGYYSFEAICARSETDIVRNSRRIFVSQHPSRDVLAARKLAVHRSPLRASFARPFAAIVDDVFRHPVASRVAEVRVPMQLVFGAGDVIVPRSLGARVSRRFQIPLTVIDDVGHLPMVEAPSHFARALGGFLAETKGGS